MAKTLYFKNVITSGALSLQDGGTAPVAALTTTGWTVAKTASARFSLMVVNAERASATFITTDALATPSFTAASCWRSESPFNGTFANTNWSLAFRVRAQTAAGNQAGRVKCRLWKSSNADGTGATQLTSTALTGSTTAALSTTVSQTSTVTWVPGGPVTFTNEYLWVQCEWEITTVSSSTTADVLFYVESAGAVTTPDFTIPPQALTPALVADSDSFAVQALAQDVTLASGVFDVADDIIGMVVVITVSPLSPEVVIDEDATTSSELATSAQIEPPLFADDAELSYEETLSTSIEVLPDMAVASDDNIPPPIANAFFPDLYLIPAEMSEPDDIITLDTLSVSAIEFTHGDPYSDDDVMFGGELGLGLLPGLVDDVDDFPYKQNKEPKIENLGAEMLEQKSTHNESDGIYLPELVASWEMSPEYFDEGDNIMPGVQDSVGGVNLFAPHVMPSGDQFHTAGIAVSANPFVALVPIRYIDSDRFLASSIRLANVSKPSKKRLMGSMTNPVYMFGNVTKPHKLKGSVGVAL